MNAAMPVVGISAVICSVFQSAVSTKPSNRPKQKGWDQPQPRPLRHSPLKLQKPRGEQSGAHQQHRSQGLMEQGCAPCEQQQRTRGDHRYPSPDGCLPYERQQREAGDEQSGPRLAKSRLQRGQPPRGQHRSHDVAQPQTCEYILQVPSPRQ